MLGSFCQAAPSLRRPCFSKFRIHKGANGPIPSGLRSTLVAVQPDEIHRGRFKRFRFAALLKPLLRMTAERLRRILPTGHDGVLFLDEKAHQMQRSEESKIRNVWWR